MKFSEVVVPNLIFYSFSDYQALLLLPRPMTTSCTKMSRRFLIKLVSENFAIKLRFVKIKTLTHYLVRNTWLLENT